MERDERTEYDEQGHVAATRDGQGRRTAFAYDDAGRLVAAHYPDGSELRLAYDGAGRLVRRTRRDGRVVSYAYDGQGRLSVVSYGPGAEIRYGYDTAGRLAEAEAPGCRTRMCYDTAGRVVGREDTVDARSYATHYRYDRGGRLAAVRAPGSPYWQRYAYDGLGRLTRLGLPGGADIVLTYDGANVEIAYPNGVRTRFQMRSPLELERISATSGPGQSILDLGYESDGRGNITRINDRRFEYDDRDRLVGCHGGAQAAARYSYDQDGNRQVAGEPAVERTYDAGGHVVAQERGRARWTYEYDALDRLTAVRRDGTTVAEHVYDFRGQRVLKRGSAGTVVYHYDPQGFCLGESRDGKLACLNLGTATTLLGRLYLDGGRPRAEYLHHDHLSSVRAVTDEAGQVTARLDYTPFGRLRGVPAAGARPIFAGKPLDVESGLYYFGARYYDPASGSFLTPDPYTFRPDDERLYVPQPAGTAPLAWRDFLRPGDAARREDAPALDAWLQARLDPHPYAYAHHNPIKYVDLDGHQAGWYFLYTLLALVWSIPYTVGAFISWEVWFNWIFYILIAFAWAWDRDAAGDFPYEYLGRAEDRLGAWAWFINGGLSGKMVMGGAFTQGNIVLGRWDAVKSLDDTTANFAVPNAPDLAALVTERRAGDVHELRHVNQFAWWGPLMMPWVLLAYYLANLIFVTAAIGLGTPFSQTARDAVVTLWRAQWTAIREAWIGLLVAIPFLPGAYWWDYIGNVGYGGCWHEQDAFRHSGFGPSINTIITAMDESLGPGGTTLVTVAYDSNAVGGYTAAHAQAIPVPTINPNSSGATIVPEPAFEAALTAGTLVNLRVFQYTAGATAGTDTLNVTYGGTDASVDIEVE